MAQSRKKAIMDQVEKQRRRNRIISLAAIALIAVVAVTVVVYSFSLFRGTAVPLPAYLDRCVSGSLFYHAHPQVAININGTYFIIPANMGFSGCARVIHTHATDGVLHVETDQNRDYTLGDFFLIWGNYVNNAQTAIFNSTQIFGSHVVPGHSLTMTVNGTPDSSFQNYVIPRNAGSTADPCSTAPCSQVNIVITYA